MGQKKRKKAIERVKELEDKERMYFDTFGPIFNDEKKVQHLREMADIIEEKSKLKNQYKIK